MIINSLGLLINHLNAIIMKILKNTLFGILLLCMVTLVANAQNQAYWVHTDYVKPAKQNDYEKVCEDFAVVIEAIEKGSLDGFEESWMFD